MTDAEEEDARAKRDLSIDVDALLAAINEISESEVTRPENGDPHHASVNGHDYHTWRELAEAFELDIQDFRITEVNR
ncbi:YodD family peroxide/acid resistance protein [Superficieibacter sp.]|uniref:YodD family peroxide/acid resistance protein n=1 Tax=Superficieibacter sp. TaxID=2303322 RepID=UPI0028A5C1F6|nr:YodD family peroxide/acid resistance protein [Superficieibacter sp.]